MTKFKVGDKVRVLNAEAIKGADNHGLKTGGIYPVTSIDTHGDPRVNELTLFRSELRYIEKVADKTTKNQRISALEQTVAELKAEVEALKQAQGKTTVVSNLTVSSDADVGKIGEQLAELIAGEKVTPRKKPALTPNELRKAIIAEARAFVAEHSPFVKIDRTPLTRRVGDVRVIFEVNEKKRTVVALAKLAHVSDKYGSYKGVAKCAPTDVFNADIGKAFALGRALGLDVSKFEQAVQPTEVVAGMSVTNVPNDDYEVFGSYVVGYVDDGNAYDDDTSDGEGWIPVELLRILDDTEAQYE